MMIRYDSKSTQYKQPFGCLRQDQPCTIRIEIPSGIEFSQALLCIESDDGRFSRSFPMEYVRSVEGAQTAEDYKIYQCVFSLSECNLYFYYFTIHTPNSTFNVFKDGSHDTSTSRGDRWQLTCFDRDYDNPEDFKGKVMYQIFPDRFYSVGSCDTSQKLQPFHLHQSTKDVPIYYPDQNGVVQNNDFFGGNLQGIIEKLPYIAELNVSILYLNPVFMAYSNHRYDTADYMRIDPMLGTEEDFKELCRRAHQLGIKVILDVVFSHTGSNSIYFDKNNIFGNGAYHHPDSPYRSWFQFNPNNPKEYTSWWGIDTLPCTNEMDESFLDFIIRGEDSVIRHWMRAGVDGFRLDVADELPDEFITLLNQEVKKIKPDSLVIGEVWEDASNKISYGVRRKYFTAKELDSVMNYPYKDSIIGFIQGDRTAGQLADTVMTLAENYPKPVLDCVMNSLSTHDTMRILTVFGTENFNITRDEKAYSHLTPEQKKRAMEKLKAASFLQFTLPGTACIYYGDEAGAEGFEDPFNRRYFPWDSLNVDLLEFYQELSRLKTTHPALQTGDIQIVCKEDGVFAFRRQHQDEILYGIVSVRGDRFRSFTNFEVLMLHNGRQLGRQIVLEHCGFVLLREKN